MCVIAEQVANSLIFMSVKIIISSSIGTYDDAVRSVATGLSNGMCACYVTYLPMYVPTYLPTPT